MASKDNPPLEFGSNEKLKGRDRELRTLINILEPDPEYQPFFLADDATVFEITWESEGEIIRRLKCYFGGGFDVPVHLPLWEFIDKIRGQFPEWPED